MEQIHDAAFFQKEYTGVLLEDGQPLPANRAQRLTPPTLTLKCKRAPKTAVRMTHHYRQHNILNLRMLCYIHISIFVFEMNI